MTITQILLINLCYLPTTPTNARITNQSSRRIQESKKINRPHKIPTTNQRPHRLPRSTSTGNIYQRLPWTTSIGNGYHFHLLSQRARHHKLPPLLQETPQQFRATHEHQNNSFDPIGTTHRTRTTGIYKANRVQTLLRRWHINRSPPTPRNVPNPPSTISPPQTLTKHTTYTTYTAPPTKSCSVASIQ